ncbi:hypothetical protein, partial [Phyllobacterium zundukense]
SRENLKPWQSFGTVAKAEILRDQPWLSHLPQQGLDPAIAASIEPKTTKMSNLESQNWVSRFRAEIDTLPI